MRLRPRTRTMLRVGYYYHHKMDFFVVYLRLFLFIYLFILNIKRFENKYQHKGLANNMP